MIGHHSSFVAPPAAVRPLDSLDPSAVQVQHSGRSGRKSVEVGSWSIACAVAAHVAVDRRRPDSYSFLLARCDHPALEDTGIAR